MDFLYWIITIFSDRNKVDGKLKGSSKRIGGAIFTILFFYLVLYALHSKTKIPNFELIRDALEYVFYSIILMAFGISAVGIVGKIRNNNIITGSTDADITINQQEEQTD